MSKVIISKTAAYKKLTLETDVIKHTMVVFPFHGKLGYTYTFKKEKFKKLGQAFKQI